jgi:hypothetical protein
VKVDDNLGTYFQVAPRQPRGFEILVFEREFLTQKQRDTRETQLNTIMDKAMSNPHPSVKQARATAEALVKLMRLPNWSYDNIGVDISLNGPEYAYPDSDKEYAEAEHFADRIAALLKPYERTRQVGGGSRHQ